MKRLFVVLALMIAFSAHSQDLPTEPATGFTFPLGCKFTLKIYPTDSTNFDYSIIAFERFEEIIDTWNNDSLFEKNSKENGTIEFYFCIGTEGKTEEEKEENMKILLLMKNRTKYSLNYTSEIQTEEDGTFELTSNVGTFSGAKGTEMWPYFIYQIALSDFKIATFRD